MLDNFDVGASNGPVEANNGRLEHLRGIAYGFRNMNYIRLAVTDSFRRTLF
ncbi:transposase [Corynebacterium nasicanis]|uniref:Transposase n=1 Tax=Corynebacterium nasicanis TaxID=1448267 RepID=A0ABW1QAZ3_9CORY